MTQPTPMPTASPALAALLASRTVEDLKWLALAIGKLPPARKAELVQFIVTGLTDPTRLAQLCAALSETERLVVAEVIHNLGGRYDTDVIEAKYGAVQRPRSAGELWGTTILGASKRRPAARPFDLLFGTDPALGRVVASDLADLLRQILPPPPTPVRQGAPEPPPIPQPDPRYAAPELYTSQGEATIFPDLSVALTMISQGKVGVSASTSMPTLATLRALRERLAGGDAFADLDYARAEDAIRPLALIMLIQAAKWAAPGAGGKLALTRAGEKLLAGPITAQPIREAWERWLRSDLLDELSRVRGIKGQQAKGVRLSKPASRRGKLAEALADYPVGEWFLFSDLLRQMRADRRLPEIERNEHTRLYLGSSQEYGWLGYSGVRYWDVVQGSYIRVLLWEYAATLGMVEVAYTEAELSPHSFGELYGIEGEPISRYDGLWAFRLTDLGAFVLGLRDSYTPPQPAPAAASAPALRLLPDLTVELTEPDRLQPQDRATLEQIAAPISRLKFTYRLDSEKLLEAAQYGLSVAQVREFLAARAGLPTDALPADLRALLDDLERRTTLLREGGRMALIESDDPSLLADLAANPALRGLCRLATVGGATALLIPDEHEAAARRLLRKLGYIPQKR